MSRYFFLLFLLVAAMRVEAINLQGYYFSDAYKYAIIEDSRILKHPGSFVVTTSFSYINEPLVITDYDSTTKLNVAMENFIVGTLGASFYFNRWLSFGADIAYLRSSASDYLLNTTEYIGETKGSMADSLLRAKIRVYRNKKSKTAITLIPSIGLATGSLENYSTDDGNRYSLLGVFEKLWSRWAIQGGLGYSDSSKANYKEIDYRSLALTQLGISYRMTQNWNLNFELVRNFALKGKEQDAGDYYVTLKGKVHKNFALYGGLGIAGFNEVDRNNYTAFVGLKLHPSKGSKRPVRSGPMPEPVVEPPVPEVPAIVEARDQEKQLGTLFKADRVYFDNSSSIIKNNERLKLDELADYLIQNESGVSKVIIEGYASKVGSARFNQVLSDTRSKNVLTYLAEKGVNPDLLQTVAYGDDYLNEEAEHWMNRRVEFRVYTREQQAL